MIESWERGRERPLTVTKKCIIYIFFCLCRGALQRLEKEASIPLRGMNDIDSNLSCLSNKKIDMLRRRESSTPGERIK